MSNNIAFCTSITINELGPISDVQVFFKCINQYVVKQYPKNNWDLITDRLYKRYIRYEELPTFIEKINEIKTIFANIPTDKVNFKKFGVNFDDTNLNLQGKNLSNTFKKYFDHLEDCIETAELIKKERGSYEPIRIVVSDLPEFYADDDRPLEDYDNLEGEPFWMRTEPTMEAFNIEEKVDQEFGGIIKTSWVRKKEK